MSPAAPAAYFPPVEFADDDGLLMFDGDLTTAWLLEAYRNGIFPWPIVRRRTEHLSWWSPDPRAVLELDCLRVSRRLRRRLDSGRFNVSINRDFAGVIRACAQPRDERGGSWITPALIDAFLEFHRAGYAHSVEVWDDDRLVGGIYGVAIGGFFAGESMFHRTTDGSKMALVHLVNRLRERSFVLFDIQQATPHTISLGATEIPRSRFLRRLHDAISLPVTFAD